jgi:LPXTG-motif cell wall-anchored protein
VTVSYTVTVNSADTILGDARLNNALITPDCPNPAIFDTSDPNYEPNCVTSTPVSAWIATKVMSTSGAIQPGEEVDYTITVKNTGAVDLAGADALALDDDLTDVLDDASFDDANAQATSGTLTYASPTLHWEGDLNAGQTATITYSAVVNPLDSIGNASLANAIGAGPMNCPATPTTDSGDPSFSTSCATLTSIDMTDPSSPTGPGTTPNPSESGDGLANTGQNLWVYILGAGLLIFGGLSVIIRKKSLSLWVR